MVRRSLIGGPIKTSRHCIGGTVPDTDRWLYGGQSAVLGRLLSGERDECVCITVDGRRTQQTTIDYGAGVHDLSADKSSDGFRKRTVNILPFI